MIVLICLWLMDIFRWICWLMDTIRGLMRGRIIECCNIIIVVGDVAAD